MQKQLTLFWKQKREAKKTAIEPDFFKIKTLVDWEAFRTPLLQAFDRPVAGEKGGRPPYDVLLMFRILILQELHQLSDDAMEFQLYDRGSFQQFVGIKDGDSIPDAKTIWLFRNQLAQQGVHRALFDAFEAQLHRQGYHARAGQIIDASILEARKPCSLNKTVYKTPAAQAQHDGEATFTKKGDKTFFGYKNHINVDRKHRFVRAYDVTTASTHDSQVFESVVDPKNSSLDLWADSAYKSEERDRWCEEKAYRNKIHHRAYRNRPLDSRQKRSNKARSKIRALVEHPFSYAKNWGKRVAIRTIGLARATLNCCLKNLSYNLRRFVFLEIRRAKCA